jgi:Pre-mRNA cleavage and polyadenylation specificity factor
LEVRQLSNASSEEMASLPVVLSAPINGRIATLLSFRHPSSETDYIFFTTETKQYAVLSYVAPEDADSNAVYNLVTHASGNLADHGMALRGNEPESGPIAALEPNHTCIALHLYEGFLTILPIQKSYHYSGKSLSATNVSKRGGRHSEILGHAFHCRIEERDVYSMSFLLSTDISGRYMPQLAFLHQDSRGNQHVVAHSINLQEKSIVLHSAVSPIGSNVKKAAVPPLVQHRLKKNRVDGASGLIIAVPPVGRSEKNMDLSEKGESNVDDIAPPFGGILILGEQQITFHDTAKNCTKMLPTPQRLTLTCARVHPLGAPSNNADHDIVRYLLGDEDGKLHVLAVIRSMNGNVERLQIENLGVTNISSTLLYLERGLVFVGSQSSDSQFIQILDKPTRLSDEKKGDENDLIMSGQNLTYVHVLDEYKNLGPIVDFDVIPMSHNSYGVVNDSLASQCMAVTASGTEKDGSVRFIRNGTGFFEHASVELGGIKGMWALRKSFHDHDDAFLVQSYMGETRIFGVTIEDSGEEGSTSDWDGTSATLSEMQLPDFECENMTLYAGNVIVDTDSDLSLFLQITKRSIRLISLTRSQCVSNWSAQHGESFTIASANESGQIIVVSKGGKIEYLQIVRTDNNGLKIDLKGVAQIGKEVSCVNLNAFEESTDSIQKPAIKDVGTPMEIDYELSEGRSAPKSKIVVVGLWDETNLLVLSLDDASPLRTISRIQLNREVPGQQTCYTNVAQKMARSVCLVTLGSLGYCSDFTKGENDRKEAKNGVNMILIGLGNGVLISFVVNETQEGSWDFTSRREVSIGTRALNLVVFPKHSGTKGACVLATGDRPTIIYLSGGSVKSSKTSRLCYSNIHLSCDDEFENGAEPSIEKNAQLIVNVAAPFRASSLLDDSSNHSDDSYSLCLSDDTTMRIGMIDNIQKLHVTTHKLGMPPRKVAHDVKNRLLCVGCIDQNTSSLQYSNRAETNTGNCVRLFDDSTFEEIDRIDLDPYEMILSLICTQLKVTPNDDFTPETSTIKESEHVDASDSFDPYIILGTGYGFPEDDEPSRGRIIVLECNRDRSNNMFSRKVKKVAELQVRGGVFSICPFYDGSILASINSKTRLCRLVGQENNGVLDLKIVGAGHHGHILSLVVKSLSEEISNADNNTREQLAIVGDMVRSISVLKYYSEYQTLEEIARDFNQNWVTAVEMLTDNIYLGAENFNNIFALRRNPNSSSQEVRCRLDTIGVFHIGEMVNKFLKGSLVLPSHTAGNSGNISTFGQYLGDGNDGIRKMTPKLGSQTLFGTVDGTLGAIIGLDVNSSLFFMALQRSMAKIVKPVGYLKHGDYRSFRIPRGCQPSRGFIDGDFVESFAELDPAMMEAIVQEMNKEDKWYKVESNDNNRKNDAAKKELRPKLTVEEVLAMIEDMAMAH